MGINTFRYSKYIIWKNIVIFMIMVLAGIGMGIGQVDADEIKGVYVSGAGWVDLAKTTGVPSTSTRGSSTSTTTTTLYYIQAHIKIWHTGPLLQAQSNKAWYWSTGGNTDSIFSSGYGDYSVTRHKSQYLTGYSTATEYTSWNSAYSCSNAWNTYINPGC